MSRLRRKKEYRISASADDLVAPEETLIDNTSAHADIESPISDGFFRFTSISTAACLVVLAGMTAHLTILRHDYFQDLAMQNKTVNFSVAPPRGIIVDRNQRVLVNNIASFDLLVISRELPRVTQLRSQQLESVADILGTAPGEFAEKIRVNSAKNAVFFAATNIPKEKVLAVKTLNPKGFYVLTGTRRSYVDGHQFSHILGYIGKVSREDLFEDLYYLSSDSVGRMGIEAAYETVLRGKHGNVTFTKKDERGSSEDPEIGDTVVLNIDYDLQKRLYNELFQILLAENLGQAAAIIQDVKTGAVRALVSFPAFDNNIFSDEVSQDEYTQLFESKLRPLFNRVIGGLYNPGSTIKPFIGLAALFEKIIRPTDTIQDCISLTVPNPNKPSEPYIFNNWRDDFGPFNLRRAIAQSCNIFFFAVGGGLDNIAGLGIEKIAKYLKAAFADKELGIDLPGEIGGFVPTPEWKSETRDEPWYLGDTYNTSIGQGDLLVTPLWLNSYIAAIANGGTLYQPQVVSKIVGKDGITIQRLVPRAVGKLPFDAPAISEIRSDMRETVLSGTARLLQDVPVPVSAKTGTAEIIKGRRINSLFTAFAPSDDPELVITVLIEGSVSNEGYAIIAANEVLKYYFSKSNGN